jgi:hypothetical protein
MNIGKGILRGAEQQRSELPLRGPLQLARNAAAAVLRNTRQALARGDRFFWIQRVSWHDVKSANPAVSFSALQTCAVRTPIAAVFWPGDWSTNGSSPPSVA